MTGVVTDKPSGTTPVTDKVAEPITYVPPAPTCQPIEPAECSPLAAAFATLQENVLTWWRAHSDPEYRARFQEWVIGLNEPASEAKPEPAQADIQAEGEAVQSEPEARPDPALDEIRAGGKSWVGPAWRREHGIDDDTVERLIAAGSLRRHPTSSANVGIAA